MQLQFLYLTKEHNKESENYSLLKNLDLNNSADYYGDFICQNIQIFNKFDKYEYIKCKNFILVLYNEKKHSF